MKTISSCPGYIRATTPVSTSKGSRSRWKRASFHASAGYRFPVAFSPRVISFHRFFLSREEKKKKKTGTLRLAGHTESLRGLWFRIKSFVEDGSQRHPLRDWPESLSTAIHAKLCRCLPFTLKFRIILQAAQEDLLLLLFLRSIRLSPMRILSSNLRESFSIEA